MYNLYSNSQLGATYCKYDGNAIDGDDVSGSGGDFR